MSDHCGAYGCDETPTDLFDIAVGSVPEGMEELDTTVEYCPLHAAQAMRTNAVLLARGDRPERFWLRKVDDPDQEAGETVTVELSDEDRARLELIRDHDGNDLSEKDDALLTRLAALKGAE